MHFHMGNIFSTLSTINVKRALQFMFQAVSCKSSPLLQKEVLYFCMDFHSVSIITTILSVCFHPKTGFFFFVDSFAIICRRLTLNLMLEEIDSIYKIGFLKQNFILPASNPIWCFVTFCNL